MQSSKYHKSFNIIFRISSPKWNWKNFPGAFSWSYFSENPLKLKIYVTSYTLIKIPRVKLGQESLIDEMVFHVWQEFLKCYLYSKFCYKNALFMFKVSSRFKYFKCSKEDSLNEIHFRIYYIYFKFLSY